MFLLLILFLFSSACVLDQDYPGKELLIPIDCNFYISKERPVIYYIKEKDFLGVTFTLGIINSTLVANRQTDSFCPNVFNSCCLCDIRPSKHILVRARDNDKFIIQLEGEALWIGDGLIYDVYVKDDRMAKVFYLYK